MSSSDGDAPRRRRKRKDGRNMQNSDSPKPAAEVEAEVKTEKLEQPTVEPTNTVPVQMQVADIRDVVSGNVPTPTKVENPVEQKSEEEDEEEELEDDEEYEYYYEDENNNEVVVGTSSTTDNSLEALLADARKMRADDSAKVVEEDTSIKSKIRSVISTIVTADFFVVCALLAWFLAGIFCSYILKDDTVQIAFNGKFESVVQPALGILMIGSAAGAVFDESEEETY